MLGLLGALALLLPPRQDPTPPPDPDDVPVTIKEIDLDGAIREFEEFRRRLGRYRDEIGEGRRVAQETAQLLEELRNEASPENGYNEEAILEAVANYVDGVVTKQVELVDFLESQRYRISYYANKMAASVRAEDLALLFGSVERNQAAIGARVRELDAARKAVADLVDSLPSDQIDRETFRPTEAMPREVKRRLDVLLYQYQNQRNALDLAKKRLQVVRAAQRAQSHDRGAPPDLDPDLLVGRMFGALDRIRLQMSMDLLYFEQLIGGYARSTRTQEILEAFQNLIELQGAVEGPSPELASVLDWLQDSSARRITTSAAGLSKPGWDVPRYSDLLREAYLGARGVEE